MYEYVLRNFYNELVEVNRCLTLLTHFLLHQIHFIRSPCKYDLGKLLIYSSNQ